jgi:hypothetical protein
MNYQLYTSGLIPLDWTFAFFTVNEFKERIKKKAEENQYFFNITVTDPEGLVKQIDDLLTEAEQAAKASHWDGVYRDEPLIFAIPAGDTNVLKGEYGGIGTALFGIIIKQDEDGDTFIYSPVELKHLE